MNGVLLVTPLRTMKKRKRRDAAMRIRETIPVAPPVELVSIPVCHANANWRDAIESTYVLHP